MPSESAAVTAVPRSHEEARGWYDRLARWYHIVGDPFEAPNRRRGLALLDVRPGETVLEVGPGTGEAVVELALDAGPDGRAVAVDVSGAMCHETRERALRARLGGRVAVAQGDALHLPLRDASVDAAFLSGVLELFDTPEIPRVLDELRRVLRPEGRLGVVALSRRNEGVAVRLYEGLHVRFPREIDCRPILAMEHVTKAGFIVEDIEERHMTGLPVDVLVARRSEP